MILMYWQAVEQIFEKYHLIFESSKKLYLVQIPSIHQKQTSLFSFCVLTAVPTWGIAFDFYHAPQLPSNSASVVGKEAQQITSIHPLM